MKHHVWYATHNYLMGWISVWYETWHYLMNVSIELKTVSVMQRHIIACTWLPLE